MVEFGTVRQVAKTKLVSENFLRGLIAQGKCPGIRSGNRFLVNVTALREMLDEQSRKAVNEK